MTPTRTRRFARIAALTLALGGAAGPLTAQADAGAYLAARAATDANDFAAASRYFISALIDDPTNPQLLENALASLIGMGEPARGLPIAEQMAADGLESQLAHMLLFADAAREADWAGLLAGLDAGRSVGPLVDGLTRGWAQVGAGDMAAALATFDAVTNSPGLRGFGLYHKALALAVAGDFEAADAILALPAQDGMVRTRRSVIAHAQILSQLGRPDAATSLIDEAFGPDPDPSLTALRLRLAAGEAVPFDVVADARAGLAEVYFTVASALIPDSPEAYVLQYARIAQWLDPAHTEAVLMCAGLLEALERYDLANAAYALVPPSDPAFHAAELGRAEVLRRAGEPEVAAEVLQQLARTYPDMATVHAALGNTLRMLERDDEAVASYTRALALYPEGDGAVWFIHYTRGISEFRLGDWDAAEADFRRALDLNPGQPQVLNYLGYSLVDKGLKLDEALGMIEQAVAAEPQNGAIVDSLGWALYRLGRYDEAVTHMERAAALEAVDPIVNDHLGDVFWAVGRRIEARFQWNRALSFDPTEADAARIRRKLDVGLDAVLAEEGAPPLAVAEQDR